MCKRCRCTHKLNKYSNDIDVKLVSSSASVTHAWNPEKDNLILIILQCNARHKKCILAYPWFKNGTNLNSAKYFGTLTTWRHMKTSSLKRKDQTAFDLVYTSIFAKFNQNKFARYAY